MDETQLFWTVTDCTGRGRPALSALTRATFGAEKAWPTQPDTTPLTAFLSSFVRSSKDLMAKVCRSSGGTPARERAMCPIGVLTPSHTTIFLADACMAVSRADACLVPIL